LRIQVTIGLFAALAGSSLASAQGTGDAFVFRLPGANISSTVMLSSPVEIGSPGQTVTIPVNLSLAGATAPSSFQIDLSFDPAKLTFVSAGAGAQLTIAGAGLLLTEVSSSDVRLSASGRTQNAIAAGVVAYASFTMASPFNAASTPVTPVNCMSADALGNPLSTGCAPGTIGIFTCDVNWNANGTAGVADVQAMIDEALGILPAINDLNQDGVVNLADIQTVIDAARGWGCLK
jgi:hypothetical protein